MNHPSQFYPYGTLFAKLKLSRNQNSRICGHNIVSFTLKCIWLDIIIIYLSRLTEPMIFFFILITIAFSIEFLDILQHFVFLFFIFMPEKTNGYTAKFCVFFYF